MKLITRLKDKIASLYARIMPGNQEMDASSLPTNDTLEDHRREILRVGKKHSRPLSTTQRKVVFMSAIIAILMLVLTTTLYIRSVYFQTSTSGLVGSIARVIPTPVLEVNGDTIDYEEIIFHFNTAQNVQASEQLSVDTERAFLSAVEKSLRNQAIKQIAAEQQVDVSAEEVAAGIKEPIAVAGGEETFEATLMDTYGWTKDDFTREFKVQLLRSRLITGRLFDFTQQMSAQNFESLATASSLTYESVQVDEDTELLPELADAAETLTVGSLSELVYGEESVFVIYRPSESTLQYVSENYSEVDQYISERLTAATIYSCLNRTIGIEQAVDVAWYSCFR